MTPLVAWLARFLWRSLVSFSRLSRTASLRLCWTQVHTTHNDLAEIHLELLSGVVGILLLDLPLTMTKVDVTSSITLVITEGGCSLKAPL
jgi:hypothetical protein